MGGQPDTHVWGVPVGACVGPLPLHVVEWCSERTCQYLGNAKVMKVPCNLWHVVLEKLGAEIVTLHLDQWEEHSMSHP